MTCTTTTKFWHGCLGVVGSALARCCTLLLLSLAGISIRREGQAIGPRTLKISRQLEIKEYWEEVPLTEGEGGSATSMFLEVWSDCALYK